MRKEEIVKKVIAFCVVGNPVAKGRPRFMARPYINKYGKPKAFTQVYTPKETATAEKDFKSQALRYKPNELITSDIWLTVRIYRETPKSLSNKKALQAESGTLRPTTKPDADNYLKLVCDSLNEIMWKDDSQVIEAHVSKRYSSNPRTEVEIEYYDSGQDEIDRALGAMVVRE